MTKINKAMTNTRVHDAARLGDRTYVELNESGIEDVHIDTLKTGVETHTNRLKAVIDETKGKSLLQLDDDQRDNTYRSLLYLNKGFLLHPDKTIREAANDVEQVLEKRGFELANMNYTAQSEADEALIRELKSEKLAPKVAILPSMQEVVDQLEADERKFQATQKAWLETKADDQLTQSASIYKLELMKYINDKVVTYLRAMQQINPEPYQQLITRISLLIDESNELVKSRQNNEEEIEASN